MWAALQTYFTDKWLERKQYSVTMAKQSRFKEAVLLAKETAAAEEEGESQAMLFAMLQEQHNKQIAAMAATNKASMNAMMEKMNALVAGRGGNRRTPTKQLDKNNTPPRREHTPPGRHKQHQETQETKSHLSPPQNICPPQTGKLSRARGKQKQALARLEVCPCHRLTSTGDANSRCRVSNLSINNLAKLELLVPACLSSQRTGGTNIRISHQH